MTEKTMEQTLLTIDNYLDGVLMDDDVIGGVAESEDGRYAAYVVRFTTAETLSYQEFAKLDEALAHISGVDRKWEFREVGGDCGGECSGNCHEHGEEDDHGCCGGENHDPRDPGPGGCGCGN